MKKIKIITATKKGYDEVTYGDGVRLDHPGSKTGRGRTQKKQVGTITCSCNWGTITNDGKIRKLTPLEFERVQGFEDNWTKYGDDGSEIPDSQRYKCVGNAVTTSVITHIINNWKLEV